MMKVGIAQLSPVWLQKKCTLEKIESYIEQAAKQNCDLVSFGETLLPGYPFWLSFTGGAEFNSSFQKEMYAHYLSQSVNITNGDLSSIQKLAKDNKIAVYLGVAERAQDRGGHSIYCSLVYINKEGAVQSVHRKVQPTYEERLVWAPGDGHGLKVHALEEFTVGGLNCWENWMPLSRTALYVQGENAHVAVWPGGTSLTEDITRFIAKESRSFVISASAILTKENISDTIPYFDEIRKKAPQVLANGGSCIAAPDGSWVLEPIANKEGLFCAELDLDKVLQERQNFDVSGHYSRPDITKLTVNRQRQALVHFED